MCAEFCNLTNMLDGSDQTFSFNSSAFISLVFDTEISGLQYARALSTITGYRGYGAEQGNMVDWHFFFFLFFILLFAYLNDVVRFSRFILF